MVIKGDSGPQDEDAEVFSLRQIGTAADLDRLQDVAPDFVLNEGDSQNTEYLAKYKKYESDQFHLDDDGLYEEHDDEQSKHSDDEGSDADSDDSGKLGKKGLDLGGDSDEEEAPASSKKKSKEAKKSAKGKVEKAKHPLITDLDHRDKGSKRDQRVNLWFEKDNLKEAAAGDVDEDFDLDKLSHQYKTKGVKVFGEERDEAEKLQARLPLGKKALRRERHKQDKGSDGNSSDDSDTDAEEAAGDIAKGTKKIKLNEQELALGALMVQGLKTKRDLFDAAWNRYTFNDEHLPEWFVEDENQHMRKEAPVPKELLEEYQKKMDEVNVRPIKKVMEAKARKRRRAVKRFEKAKKKAENILESGDITSQEKMRQIKK